MKYAKNNISKKIVHESVICFLVITAALKELKDVLFIY